MRGLANGWLTALLVGLPYGLYLQLPGSVDMATTGIIALVIGILGALVFTLVDGFLGIQLTEIRPAETFGWSWTRMGRNLVKYMFSGLLGALIVGALIGLLFGTFQYATHAVKDVPGMLLVIVQTGMLGFVRQFGAFITFVSALLGALIGGGSSEILNERHLTRPNQGIRHSALHSMLIGCLGVLIGGVGGGWLAGIITGSYNPLLPLAYGLILGPVIGVVSGLRSGGIACIQHLVLRWLFWETNAMPWNYTRFLDYSTEHVLLRKVGGGYIFVHRLLLEYFASL